MNGIIEKIIIYPEKGAAGVELTEAQFIENLGLEGDCHAKGGERQVSLFFAESREKITGAKEKGLCFKRFGENISVRDISPSLLIPGVRFAAGEAVLQITKEIKHCHEECVLYESGKPCLLAGQSLFAKVVKSGFIRTGDSVIM